MAIRKIPTNTSTFNFYNANPKDKRTADCVVRALSLFLDKTWEEVMEGLFEVAMKNKLMLNDKACYKKYLKNLGYEMVKQPRKSDNTKYTGVEFCKRIADSNKLYLAHIGGNHIVCIKDKKVNDIWNSTEGCIGNLWVRMV